MKSFFELDLDLYSFLSKLGAYTFLMLFFLYQFQNQSFIINQDFLYFNLSIVAGVFIAMFFLALDFFNERRLRRFYWIMFVADIFVLYGIAELGSLSIILLSALFCLNILACSLVMRSSLTHLVSGLSCFVFTFFFIRSGFTDSSTSVFFFVINLFGMSLISILGQSLREQLFLVKERIDVILENLKKQKTLNQVIFDSIKSCVFVLNPKGSLVSTNYRGEELLSEFTFLISHLKSLFTGNSNEENILDLGGRKFSVSKSPLKYKDYEESLGDVFLATDETVKMKLNEQLTEAEKLAAVGRLSAGLAHEIRNPLAGISGSIEMLEASTADEESRKLYSIVIREIDRLNGLVTEFLNFARPEVDRKDSVSIKELLSEILSVLKNDIHVSSLNIQFTMEAENYLLVLDKNKFKQAILNIILNAAQATETVARKREITIKGLVLEEGYRILIQDNGIGIDKDEIKRIFEPFHTTKDKGTGLGLAVTRRILESHGAKLSVDSKLDEGTSFSIIIPKEEHGVNSTRKFTV